MIAIAKKTLRSIKSTPGMTIDLIRLDSFVAKECGGNLAFILNCGKLLLLCEFRDDEFGVFDLFDLGDLIWGD